MALTLLFGVSVALSVSVHVNLRHCVFSHPCRKDNRVCKDIKLETAARHPFSCQQSDVHLSLRMELRLLSCAAYRELPPHLCLVLISQDGHQKLYSTADNLCSCKTLKDPHHMCGSTFFSAFWINKLHNFKNCHIMQSCMNMTSVLCVFLQRELQPTETGDFTV